MAKDDYKAWDKGCLKRSSYMHHNRSLHEQIVPICPHKETRRQARD
jgi:hypothetical protein